MSQLALSVMDLIPVRDGQRSSDAVAASVALARHADQLGYTRYWIGEHHNDRALSSTSPAVMLGVLAGRTRRIRLGSGGVMLPNHAPLVVSEQFALLEAAAPGRIDLGIGRAPGSDPTVTSLLHVDGHASDATRLPEHLELIRAMTSLDGADLRTASGDYYTIRATPAASSTPNLWLLGTSEYSAELAARLGLGYVFAHQFSEPDTQRVLDVYREQFRPSAQMHAPEIILAVRAVVADSDDEARRLALPQVHQLVTPSNGAAAAPFATVDAAEHATLPASQSNVVLALLNKLFVGEVSAVTQRLAVLAAKLGVNELMIAPIAGGYASDPLDHTPARERTLELLAQHLL